MLVLTGLSINSKTKYVLSLKTEGRDLFFTDIDKIREIMLEELKNN